MAAAFFLGALVSGCSLEPPQAAAQRRQVQEAGRPYEAPFDARKLPELPAQPSWQDVLNRALLASGDLEAAYFDWKAAVHAAQVAGAYPNNNAAFGYSYLFSREKAKSWDRNTLSAGFDPSTNLPLPFKISAAAKVAFEAAQAKAKRFEAAKFELQKKVLTAYFDFALAAEKLRIQTENAKLLKMLADIAEQRVRGGAPQADLLKAQTEYELALNEQSNLAVELTSLRAGLNGLMLLPAGAPLAAPAELPPPRRIPAGDGDLIALAAGNNPDLAALAKEVAAAEQALALARLGWLPEVNFQVAITGSLSQLLSGAIMFPINGEKIQAEINEAAAALRRAEALQRQGKFDLGSRFLVTLLALRNSERQAELFGKSIVPKAKQSWDSATKSYATAVTGFGFAEMLDSQRTLLSAQVLAAESRMAREKRLAELEALLGLDVETLNPAPATQPASAPATQPAVSPN